MCAKMHSTLFSLLALLLISFTAAINSFNNQDGNGIQIRAVVPPVRAPPKSNPVEDPSPYSPSNPRPESEPPSVIDPFRSDPESDGSPTYRDPSAIQSAHSIGENPNQGSTGKATDSLNPCKTGSEHCNEMLEVAADLVHNIADGLQNIANSNDGSTTTSISTSTTSSASSTFPSGAASFNTTKKPMINANVSSWMDLTRYTHQLSFDEFDMAARSPVCFFANMEATYEVYAGYADQQSKSSMSTISTSDPVADLYLRYLPSQIQMVYSSTPTSLVVTATSTTACSSLDGQGTFVATYALFGYKAGYAPAATSASSTQSSSRDRLFSASPAKNRVPAKLCGALGFLLFCIMVML